MNRTNYVLWDLLEDHFVDITEMAGGGSFMVRNLDCRQTSIAPYTAALRIRLRLGGDEQVTWEIAAASTGRLTALRASQ